MLYFTFLRVGCELLAPVIESGCDVIYVDKSFVFLTMWMEWPEY